MKALKTLPAATVVVAISSSHGPGTAMQMGLVPKRPCLACQGGTMGEALHITMPISPASRIFSAHQAQAPKRFASDLMGLVPKRPCLACQGGTMGEALHITMPISPASRIFSAHQAQAPKWFDSRAVTSATPCWPAMRVAWPQQVSAIHCPMRSEERRVGKE